MPFTIDFAGKCVIVTGGNRGIGLAISQAVAKAGATVAIIYHSSKSAPEEAAKIAKEYGVKCEAFQSDVGDADKIKKTFNEINEKLGPVTGMVANAGISVVKPALELTSEDFTKVYNTNVLGQFLCAQAAADLWIRNESQGGSIVFTSSMSSQIVNRGITQTFYNSSKAAASSIVKQLAVEWAEHGIRVNALCPGYTKTDQTSGMDKDFLKWQNDLVPMKRFAEPEEQAGMAVFLLSDAASYMTGTEYFVDGGAQTW